MSSLKDIDLNELQQRIDNGEIENPMECKLAEDFMIWVWLRGVDPKIFDLPAKG